jgi:3'-phosphoadenosine 5'-phosphosulfate sulfotransferase (PAPS reductase)/FAD synthetase
MNLTILDHKRERLANKRAENAAKTEAAHKRFLNAESIPAPSDNYPNLVRNGDLLPLSDYDKIIYSYSGGKDSLAGLLQLLERCEAQNIPKNRIEMWHQHVDGDPNDRNGLMDWPCTETYCRATAEALNLTLRFQWRVGGIERELIRENTTVQGVCYENQNGDIIFLPPSGPANKCKCGYEYPHKGLLSCPKCGNPRGNIGTRRKFPMVTADLKKRWCSGVAKIDVARRTISNDPRFNFGNFLMLTGERREESPARSKYEEVVEYNRTRTRRVDQWRNVLDWDEYQVWDTIRRWKIDPHPAYKLGWGRVSCMCCIYGDEDQWASVRTLDANRFNRIATYEVDFGLTIATKKEGKETAPYSVVEKADLGESFVVSAPAEIVEQAMGEGYNASQVFVNNWELPKGAFKRCPGPE